MSVQNVATVRRIYEAWASGESAAARLDVNWDREDALDDLGLHGRHRGTSL